MSLYPPPAGTYAEQPPPILRPGTNRASTNSATPDKHRPRTYSHPPPNQPNTASPGHYQTPYTTPYAQPIQTPYPQQDIYTTSPPPLPMPQPAPIYGPPPPQQYPQPVVGVRHSSYTRPPLPVDDYDPRSSHSSHRSHESRRSRRSKHSDDDDGRHYGDGRAKRGRRASVDDIDKRPTMGDSVIAFYKLMKGALGPRDK